MTENFNSTGSSPDPFKLPSDAEISSLVGDVPVISFRPEDLPNFKSRGSHYTEEDKEIRRMAAAEFIYKNFPQYQTELTLENMGSLADDNFGSVLTLQPRTSEGISPKLFVLKRPSLAVTYTNAISEDLGIGLKHVTPAIPENISHFITIHHEMGHMFQAVQKRYFSNDPIGKFISELDAETHALYELKKITSDDTYIRATILDRAISGFTKSAPEYWIAPHLTKIFLENDRQSALNLEPDNVWKSYSEIRLRAAVLACHEHMFVKMDDSKETTDLWKNADDWLLGLPSNLLQEALTLHRNGQTHDILNIQGTSQDELKSIANGITNTDAIRQSNYYALQMNGGVIYSKLKQIREWGNIDAFTHDNVTQIIEAFHLLCPKLVKTVDPSTAAARAAFPL